MSGQKESIRVVAYTDNRDVADSYAAHLQSEIGGDITVVTSLADMIECLDSLPFDDRPDLLILQEASPYIRKPARNDIYSQFSSGAARNSSTTTANSCLETLHAITDEESMYRSIPVVVYNASEREYYEAYDTAAVIELHDGFGADGSVLQNTVSKVLDRDDVSPSNCGGARVFSSEEEALRVKSTVPMRLEGHQIEQYSIDVLRSALPLENDPAYAEKLMLQPQFRSTLQRMGLLDLVGILNAQEVGVYTARLLRSASDYIQKDGVATYEDAVAYAQKQLEGSDIESGPIVMLLVAMSVSSAWHAAARGLAQAQEKGVVEPNRVRTLKALLQASIIFLEHTEDLGMKANLKAQLASKRERPMDNVVEEIEHIDEEALAKDVADLLTRFIGKSIHVDEETSVEELLVELDAMTNDVNESIVARYTLMQALEEAKASTTKESSRLTAEEAVAIRSSLDAAIANDAACGPQSKLLMFKLSEYVDEGMHYAELYHIARTLGAADKVTNNWPVHNTMSTVKRTLDDLRTALDVGYNAAHDQNVQRLPSP